MNWNVGDRVRLNREVDLYPTILCPAGEVGTITSTDDEAIWVLLDKHFAELNEWENEIQIYREYYEDALTAE